MRRYQTLYNNRRPSDYFQALWLAIASLIVGTIPVLVGASIVWMPDFIAACAFATTALLAFGIRDCLAEKTQSLMLNCRYLIGITGAAYVWGAVLSQFSGTFVSQCFFGSIAVFYGSITISFCVALASLAISMKSG